MGIGKSGIGGQHSIMKHMNKAGGGTGTKQSISKNEDIKYGGTVVDKFKTPFSQETKIVKKGGVKMRKEMGNKIIGTGEGYLEWSDIKKFGKKVKDKITGTKSSKKKTGGL